MPISWRVDPDDNFVTNNNNGTFIFKSNNTTTPRQYRIIYADNGNCTGETTYTIPVGNCNCTCTCTDIKFSANEITLKKEKDSEANVAVSFTGTCFPGNADAITDVTPPSWARVEPLGEGFYKLIATEDNTQGSRTGQLIFSICGEQCTNNTVTVIQQGVCKDDWKFTDGPTINSGWREEGEIPFAGKFTRTFFLWHKENGQWVKKTDYGKDNFSISLSSGEDLSDVNLDKPQNENAPYILSAITNACGSVNAGNDLSLIISPQECPEATAITTKMRVNYTLHIVGLDDGTPNPPVTALTAMGVGLCCKIKNCDNTYARFQFDGFQYHEYDYDDKGRTITVKELIKEVQMYHDIDLTNIEVYSLYNMGTYDNNPRCAKIISANSSDITIEYCLNCDSEHGVICNDDFHGNCNSQQND